LSCGGTIKDDGGELSLPYGSSYMAEIPLFCQWNFQAGIGFRYLLDFEFLAGNSGEEVEEVKLIIFSKLKKN